MRGCLDPNLLLSSLKIMLSVVLRVVVAESLPSMTPS